MGIEPTAIGLKGQRSTIWAKKAIADKFFSLKFKTFFWLTNRFKFLFLLQSRIASMAEWSKAADLS